MAYPTINQLKAMVRMNMIWDNPVTLANVDLIEKVYGKDVPTINLSVIPQCAIQVFALCSHKVFGYWVHRKAAFLSS